MTIKACERSALIVAAGVWICIAAPIHAAETDARPSDTTTAAESMPDKPITLDKSAKHHQAKKVASTRTRKGGKAANNDPAKAGAGRDAAKSAAIGTAIDASKPSNTDPTMPVGVANANAQWPVDAPAETPATLAAKADNMLKGLGGKADDDDATQRADGLQMVSADQLNDVDRAIAPDAPAATASTAASAPVTVSNNDNTTDQTSLIGKIFIAFGGLLTLASAARMFIA